MKSVARKTQKSSENSAEYQPPASGPNLIDAPPLICKTCNNLIPEGQLVCDCFAKRAEQEMTRSVLEGFFLRAASLALVKSSNIQSQRHLITGLPGGLSLCELQRYKRKPSDVKLVTRYDDLEKMQICTGCIYNLEKARKEILGQ
jgi:hypothetical protein